MSLKRLLPFLFVALVAALAVVSSAPAGDIADQPCPDSTGPDTATCPAGAVGTSYSLTLQLKEGSGCGPGYTTWTVSSGTFPPGLTLSSEGVISGTPTQAGDFTFYATVSYPVDPSISCNGGFSDKKLTIPINPGQPVLPKLTIGPESTSPGTVGTAYSLAMTANLADPKTWSISAGALPPGLAIDASTGVISGTPTASGSFSFTVLAVLDATRSDTKSLVVAIRDPLAITASEPFDAARTARTEVGVAFSTALAATGGFGTYTWTVAPGAILPPGVTFEPDGTLAGEPEEAGTYRFTVSVADTEGRSAAYAARVIVADRLTVFTKRLKTGRVGRVYRAKLASRGGLAPTQWRIKRGPLPRGIRFDKRTATFFGTPAKKGTWIIGVEIVDSLRVKATADVVLTVRPAPLKRSK